MKSGGMIGQRRVGTKRRGERETREKAKHGKLAGFFRVFRLVRVLRFLSSLSATLIYAPEHLPANKQVSS
jgi:hypothetical protein